MGKLGASRVSLGVTSVWLGVFWVSSGLMEDSNALMGHIGDLLLVNLRGSSGSIRDTDSSLGRLVGR